MVAFRIVVFYAEKTGRMHVNPGDPSGPVQIDLLYKSALLTNPDVTLTVLTTPETDLSHLQFPYERVNGVVDFDKLMFERTRMQRGYLMHCSLERPIAFLDTDILFGRDLSSVFNEDFDIGLTSRRNREMPFNGGVILVNNRRPDAGKRFFHDLERIYQEQESQRAQWFGDQYALAAAVGLNPDQVPEIESYERSGIRFRFLPCATYNNSPPAKTRALLRKPGNIILNHFKGGSRRQMEPYWRLHLSPDRRSGPVRFLDLGFNLAYFALTKRSYKHSHKKDARRLFNIDQQQTRSWQERAEVAGRLFELVYPKLQEPVRVVDLGCGDGKLRSFLGSNGEAIGYIGYDLLPQSPGIASLDLSKDEIPGSANLAFVLGVSEFLPDTVAALKRVHRCAPWLIISHAASDVRKMRPKHARKLNWQTYVSTGEFERRLQLAGYTVVERRITPDGKTCVWLCRADMREVQAA
jgi:hypothetical protein